jgi:FHS family glucose/mannose:H+ symporter-like MFS transporter
MSSSAALPLHRPIPRALLYSTFALTGAVTTMLGPVLPALERQWNITDERAGALFTAQFAASTLCSTLAARKVRWSMTVGMAMVALGVMLLAFSGPQTAFVAVAIFGGGLGATITAINLTVASETPPERAAAELSISNFIWVGGAIVFPAVYSGLQHYPLRNLLEVIAVLALAAAIFQGFQIVHGPGPQAADRGTAFRPRALLFAVFFFLYVGVEVSLAGWITTHSSRMGAGLSQASVIGFWSALLAGRLCTALVLHKVKEKLWFGSALALGLAGSAAIVVSSSPAVTFAAIICAGLGLAPLFPLNLAFFTRAVPDYREYGWVLACGGLGAAVLPALVGLVSTRLGSIRLGLTIPVLGIVLLAIIAATYGRLKVMDLRLGARQ